MVVCAGPAKETSVIPQLQDRNIFGMSLRTLNIAEQLISLEYHPVC